MHERRLGAPIEFAARSGKVVDATLDALKLDDVLSIDQNLTIPSGNLGLLSIGRG